jgi:hypothetical protein
MEEHALNNVNKIKRSDKVNSGAACFYGWLLLIIEGAAETVLQFKMSLKSR